MPTPPAADTLSPATRRGRGGNAAAAAAYIKISEEEIADDYPLPKQYEKVRSTPRASACAAAAPTPAAPAGRGAGGVLCWLSPPPGRLAPHDHAAPPRPAPPQVEDEEDELALLWDEELAMLDPDSLPRRLVTDFSIYNAEVGRCRGRRGAPPAPRCR